MQGNGTAQISPIETGRGFITIRELAEELGLSPRTVWRFVQQKRIETRRFGGSIRIPRQEYGRILEKGF